MSDAELCKSLRSTLWGQGHHINIKAADRIEALTAERAKAVEGLWWFAEGRFLNSGREPRECLQSVIYKARATLAEIEGEKT
jgi:hypothetical protein